MRFDPFFERDGVSVSRSPWGADDEIGRLNWMTPESRSRILSRADGSRVFDLAVDYFMGMPSWKTALDPKFEIWMTHTPQGTVNDNLSGAGETANRAYSYAGSAFSLYSHTGTHLCGLNHIGYHGRFWNGWTAETHLGSRSWKVGGVFPVIVARAVLVDVARAKGLTYLPDSYSISRQDILEALNAQRMSIDHADIALVRTGRMSVWPDQSAFLTSPPGLSLESAQLLCDELACMCLGLDCGGEALPSEPNTFLPVHAYLFATAGCPLFENLWLEELAAAGSYEFAFVAAPLKIQGSTGVPVRPIAMPLVHP